MRVLIPKNAQGEPISTHFAIDSLTTISAELDDAGRYYINIPPRTWMGLIKGRHGALWQHANPGVHF